MNTNTSMQIKPAESLLTIPMVSVLVSQFFSALADNAVLIVAIGLLKSRASEHLDSLLQEAFVIPFIVLAPFLGQIADGFPKGRVMLAGNLFKLGGAIAMMQGLNPVVIYGLIGVGAAVYSPAKYGILSDLVGPSLLVKANGLMEGSAIVAILAGVLIGGQLADVSIHLALMVITGTYALAAAINLLIPVIAPERHDLQFNPLAQIWQFFKALKVLFSNRDACFSLLGTSIFWACGSTLRLVLFAWVPVALLINDNSTPANLMGVLSIGIVLGAVAAGAFVSLVNVYRALIGGLLLGPVTLLLMQIHDIHWAMLVMVGIGACGGFFVVPLNALLQEQGHSLIGVGRALAIQNFAENAAVLLFVGGYSVLVAHHVGMNTVIMLFGLILFGSIGALAMTRVRLRQ